MRIIIVKDNQILLGKKFISGKFVYYEFPGGGVEEGDTFEDTVVKECLEEVGILVNNVRSLGVQNQYEVDYPKPERAKLYRGGQDNYFTCDYVKQDKRLYNADNDTLPYIWVTINKAIKLINEGPESRFNPARLEAIGKLSKAEKNIISAW